MNCLFDDINLKVIIDFCKISKEIPNSVKTNTELKNKIKNYYRFSLKQNVLSEKEKESFGIGSFIWIKENYKEGDTIVSIMENNKFVHSFINRNGKYLDILGITEDIDKILEDFSKDEKDNFDFQIFNSQEDFFEFLKIISK